MKVCNFGLTFKGRDSEYLTLKLMSQVEGVGYNSWQEKKVSSSSNYKY
jgi:hypothetical protein